MGVRIVWKYEQLLCGRFGSDACIKELSASNCSRIALYRPMPTRTEEGCMRFLDVRLCACITKRLSVYGKMKARRTHVRKSSGVRAGPTAPLINGSPRVSTYIHNRSVSLHALLIFFPLRAPLNRSPNENIPFLSPLKFIYPP